MGARCRVRARDRLRRGTRTWSHSAAPRRSSRGSRGGPRVVLRRQVGELRETFEEGELLRPDGAVAVLRKDHLGEALILRVLVVVLVSIEEHDEVRVLLD